jgi:hypothetical protein
MLIAATNYPILNIFWTMLEFFSSSFGYGSPSRCSPISSAAMTSGVGRRHSGSSSSS